MDHKRERQKTDIEKNPGRKTEKRDQKRDRNRSHKKGKKEKKYRQKVKVKKRRVTKQSQANIWVKTVDVVFIY